MVKGGWKRKHVPTEIDTEDDEADYSFVYSNEQIRTIIGAQDVTSHINAQYLKDIAHVCRAENNAITKKMLFSKATNKRLLQRFMDKDIKITWSWH